MASGSNQYPTGRRAPAAGMVFARTFFFDPQAMATPPTQSTVPAAQFFVPQGPATAAFCAPPQMPAMVPARFVGRHPGLPPRPSRTPPPRPPVASVGDRIEMVPLEPNHAFWAAYRSGGSRPVELDFMGLLRADPDEASSPSFEDWILEEDGSSEDM